MNLHNLIDGRWVESATKFSNHTTDGSTSHFSTGSAELVALAAEAAASAFPVFRRKSRAERAAFLREIANQIEARKSQICDISAQETGLPRARLEGECGRTTGQLRLFADHILGGDYLDRRHDVALPDRAPMPRPDLRMMQLPIGPVAVFGASNFPLAFSTAGGDTASALAAGCSVVYKGHEAHPGTTAIVAETILAAIQHCDMPVGVFNLVHGGNHDVGQALVQHPAIQAVGFTGSLTGGRVLFDLCAARRSPIPFFGELGSVNPVFVLASALKNRGPKMAQDWVASLTMGAGQFCTNPGVVFLIASKDADSFIDAATKAMAVLSAQTMLSPSITSNYQAGTRQMADISRVKCLIAPAVKGRDATPGLFCMPHDVWNTTEQVREEIFGAAGVVVIVPDMAKMIACAGQLEGQLTCTLQIDDADIGDSDGLLGVLDQKAGRILANGFPTGVEVADAMMHGGPYPASTAASATSVGTLAIRRFLRPVCYQNIPNALLPDDLRD